MPKFRVQVTEDITNNYAPVTVEAENADEAREIAEEMRVQGGLTSTSGDAVDEVRITTTEVE